MILKETEQKITSWNSVFSQTQCAGSRVSNKFFLHHQIAWMCQQWSLFSKPWEVEVLCLLLPSGISGVTIQFSSSMGYFWDQERMLCINNLKWECPSKRDDWSLKEKQKLSYCIAYAKGRDSRNWFWVDLSKLRQVLP